jgi:hypothetical protein
MRTKKCRFCALTQRSVSLFSSLCLSALLCFALPFSPPSDERFGWCGGGGSAAAAHVLYALKRVPRGTLKHTPLPNPRLNSIRSTPLHTSLTQLLCVCVCVGVHVLCGVQIKVLCSVPPAMQSTLQALWPPQTLLPLRALRCNSPHRLRPLSSLTSRCPPLPPPPPRAVQALAHAQATAKSMPRSRPLSVTDRSSACVLID